jgi:hypothetical protein
MFSEEENWDEFIDLKKTIRGAAFESDNYKKQNPRPVRSSLREQALLFR